MPLTLRPSGGQCAPAFKHLLDYQVYEDGQQIGRIYEVHAPRDPHQAWFWAIQVLDEARKKVKTSDCTRTFDEAKEAFRANWERLKAIRDSDSAKG